MGRHRAEPGEMTVGSLFTGYDGLGLAVEAVLGAKPLWFSENAPAPSKVLAYRWPEIPNLGDMTTIDWSQVPRVDIITGGFPCTDLSLAGRQEGMHAGTRSGLWAEMARAIEILRPQLIIAENVRGLLSGKAHSSVEQCPGCLDGAKLGHIRALGVVLSDLARIGYDAQWHGIRASEVGAPHQRFRVFVVAHLRNTDSGDSNRRRAAGLSRQAGPAAGFPAPAESRATAADTDGGLGDGRADQSQWSTQGRVAAGRDRGLAGTGQDVPADAGCEAVALGAGPGAGEPGGLGWSGSDDRDLPAADSGRAGLEGTLSPGGPGASRRSDSWAGGQLAAGLGTDVAADAQGDGRDEGLAESAGEFGGHDAAGSGLPDLPAADADLGGRQVGAERDGEPADGEPGALGIHADGHPGAPINWGQYGPAVQRWELITGRVAPAPTMTGPRGGQVLAPPFVEWMMGLELGHVTDPAIGLSRSQQLSVLGNGVVPQQAAAALRLLLPLADEVAA